MKVDKRKLGHKQTEAAKKKISESRMGSKNPMFGKITKGAFKKGENSGEDNLNWKGGLPNCIICGKTLSMRGYQYCMKHRRTENRSGSNHYLWKGGITPIRKKIEKSIEYKLWRKSVFERDNYTCIWCGQVGGSLEADHIRPFAYFPELRFAIDNGRTLCRPCHRTTDTYGINGRRLYG